MKPRLPYPTEGEGYTTRGVTRSSFLLSMNHSFPRLLVLLLVVLTSCSTTPDKRALQYLNTDGFGSRYTGNAEEENYITIGGTLAITDSYNEDELTVTATVDIDGTVLLPELGAVHVAGLTRTEIEALLTEKYSSYYDSLDIRVSIASGQKSYFVYGEVANAGVKTFSGDLTVFEAVMDSNPDESIANLGRVRLIRADPRDPFVIRIPINEMFIGDSTYNIHVQERDIIYVPANLLGQIGNFLDTLLAPVKQVLTGLSGAINNGRRGNGGNSSGGIFNIF